jgi:hypothetical protein
MTTTMRDIEDFYPMMRAHARQVPDPVARRCLIEAARDLCLRARIWRDDDTMTLTEPEAECLISLTDAEIIEIEEASIGTTVLTPMKVEQLDRHFPNWRDHANGTAQAVCEVYPGALTVVPRQTGELHIRFLLQPSMDATTLPQFLFQMHGPRLCKGAASIALLMPGTTFAIPDLGAAMHREFDDWIERSKYRNAKTINNVPLRSRARFF